MLNFHQLNSAISVVSVLGIAATVISMPPAHAAQIKYSGNGNVSGIEGLIVEGISYDVSFEFDTFINVFGTPNTSDFKEPTFWQNQQSAQIAANSIVSLLNSQEPVPTKINSISYVYIPYGDVVASNGSRFINNKVANFITRWDNYRGNSQDIQQLDTTTVNYALFTPKVPQTRVPEPSVLLGLLGSVSFLGIGYWRKPAFKQN